MLPMLLKIGMVCVLLEFISYFGLRSGKLGNLFFILAIIFLTLNLIITIINL